MWNELVEVLFETMAQRAVAASCKSASDSSLPVLVVDWDVCSVRSSMPSFVWKRMRDVSIHDWENYSGENEKYHYRNKYANISLGVFDRRACLRRAWSWWVSASERDWGMTYREHRFDWNASSSSPRWAKSSHENDHRDRCSESTNRTTRESRRSMWQPCRKSLLDDRRLT